MSSFLWRTVLRRRGALAAALVLVLVSAGTTLAAARGDAWRLGYLETLSGYVTGISGAHTAELLAIVNSSTAAAARAIRAEGLSPTAGALYVRNAGGGPAANFVANSGTAPFTVNRTTKITNLNADQLDGLDSSALQRRLVRTVIVSPVGTAIQNGDALLAAHDAITSASATDPYLLKIEPGTYDLGTESLVMKAFVDVEGSGPGMTTITAGDPAGCCSGTVEGAQNSTLRSLTVINTGSTGGEAYAIFAVGAGGFGIDDVEAEASGSDDNAGIAVYGGTILEVRDSVFTADGGSFASGIYVENSEATVIGTHATASGGTVVAIGLWLASSYASVRDSTMSGTTGVRLNAPAGIVYELTMDSSQVAGSINRVLLAGIGSQYTVRIGATAFDGGPASGLTSSACSQSYESTAGGVADVAGDCN